MLVKGGEYRVHLIEYAQNVIMCHVEVIIWCYSLQMLDEYLPIFFGVGSLTPGQSYDCPNASEATLKDMGKNQ